MFVYVISPTEQTVATEELVFQGDPLPAMRHVIGCAQLAVVPIADGDYAVFADAVGMLRPGRAFWRFADSGYRFAGKCVVVKIAPEGLPIGFPPDAPVDEIRASIVFYPSEELAKIEEHLAVVFNPDLQRMMPVIHREVTWHTPPELPEPEEDPPEPELTGWTVVETDDGRYRIVQQMLVGDRLMPGGFIEAANLEEARKKLPPGLQRIEPAESEPSFVVEHWRVPTH